MITKEMVLDYIVKAFSTPSGGIVRKYCNPEKICLQCENTHTHNNSFCSAKCCKAYKEEK